MQYNIGPKESDCVTTSTLVDIFCKLWGGSQDWKDGSKSGAPHESRLLKLDCSKIHSVFGWSPKWNIKMAIHKTVEWEKADNKQHITDMQIKEYGEQWMI